MIRVHMPTAHVLQVFVGLLLPAAAIFCLDTPIAAQDDTSCLVRADLAPLEDRASPIDSITFQVAGQDVKLCYGRPSCEVAR